MGIDYAKEVITWICPTTLPYMLDSQASFELAGFNGRGLADDVMDVMLVTGDWIPVSPQSTQLRSQPDIHYKKRTS